MTRAEAVEKLREFHELGAWHGCLTGDCPHDKASECVEALHDYIEEASEAAGIVLARLQELEPDETG